MSQLIDNLNTIESIKTDIKTAIENKGVDMTGVSFPGYASKIGEISGGGTVGWDQKSLTEGTIELINLDNSASFVASNAFNGNKTIQTVNLLYATSVGDNAFNGCDRLSQVRLPVCSIIRDGTFYNCKSLTQVSLPMCTKVMKDCFQGCISLSQLNLPVCSYVDNTVFWGCDRLSQVRLPVCKNIGFYVFYDCKSLSQVSLPMCSTIGVNTFQNCTSLSIITLGYSSVCSLGGSNVFTKTQITSSTGSIYVPASLVDAYKADKKWSYFSNRIFPIE